MIERSELHNILTALAGDFRHDASLSHTELADIILQRMYLLIPMMEEWVLDKKVEEIQKIIDDKK